jgi:hypothetical protein
VFLKFLTGNKIWNIDTEVGHQNFSENIMLQNKKKNWGGPILKWEAGGIDNLSIKLNWPYKRNIGNW